MAGGRPTKYNEEILEKAKHYADFFHEYGDKIPSVGGMAYALHLTKSTLHEWRNDPEKQEFSDTFDRMLHNQERMSINGGIDGSFNSTICKLLLANHDYSEKSTTELSGPNGGAIKTEQSLKQSDLDIIERFMAQKNK